MAIDPKQVQAAFLQAVAAKPDERGAILDRICAGDAELRGRVEQLLRAHDDSGELPPVAGQLKPTITFEQPTTAAPRVDLQPGSLFAGRYKLREKLGEGGMGIVWVADQTAPVQRRIALKVIKSTDDSRRLLARFEQERQALALMDHPHIAKVFDAGVSDDGRPYFVMELIKGVPLTTYCDEAKLTPRERLDLFVPVCQAVQHAHQKGIIHRDLKPSNILVGLYDGRPMPKVIDFGVAKATGPQLGEQSIYTEVGTMIGTLEYMSPEQAELNNLDIDTRSDIYALGVILYELLTGDVPFSRQELKSAGFAEMLRIIKEVEPPKPSLRLSGSGTLPSVAACRHTEPGKLRRLVRGELDWIVMKCLEKDRSRRYETANGLSVDVQHYLADEPVAAGPPSAVYRLKKFVRRNRGQVVAVGLVLLALVAGIVGTSLGLFSALAAEKRTQEALDDVTTQKNLAEKSATESKLVLGFFKDKVLAAARPKGQEGGLGTNATIREALDAAEPGIAKAFADQPTVEASIRNALGSTYFYLDEPSKAIRQYERAVALRRAALGADHPDTLTSTFDLGTAFSRAGRFDEALPLLEKSLERRKATLGGEHADTLESKSGLAAAYFEIGRFADAIILQEETLAVCKAKLGPDHRETLISMANLSVSYSSIRRKADALPLMEEVVQRWKIKYGPDNPTTLVVTRNLASLYSDTDRLTVGLPLLENTLARMKTILGVDHIDTLVCMTNLGHAYSKAGQPAKAVPLFEEVVRTKKIKNGADDRGTLASMYELALAYRDAGRLDLAVSLLEEKLRLTKNKLGPAHPETCNSMNDLAGAYWDGGKLDLALPLFKDLLAKSRNAWPTDSPHLGGQVVKVGFLLLQTKAFAEAEPLLREGLAIREKTQPEAWSTFNSKSFLGAALLGQNKYTEAEPLLLAGYEGIKQREEKIPPEGKNRLPEAVDRLIELYNATNRPEEVKKWQAERAKYPERVSMPQVDK